MKTSALAAAALLAACGSAQAQSAEQRFQGTLFIKAVTDGCVAQSGSTALVGDQWTFVFKTDADLQALSLIGQRRAMAFAPENGKFGKSGELAGTYISSSATVRQASASYSAVKIEYSKPKNDPRTVLISGKIGAFDGDTDCEVTFEAGGVRRPGF